MSWRQKTLPKREAGIVDVQLKGHEAVEITVCYTVESDKHTTNYRQTFRLSLCDTRYLGFMIQGVYKKLAEKLDDFKRAISGG